MIDGHKRIAALQHLGRDTVEATAWAMSEAEALLRDRPLRLSPQESSFTSSCLTPRPTSSLTGSTRATSRRSAGNAQVSLTWAVSSGAVTYKLYRGTSSSRENGTPIRGGLTGTSYVDVGLNNGTKYYYKVAAVNAGGTSGLSNEASATPTLGVLAK